MLQPTDILPTGTNATAIIAFGSEKTRLALSPGSELKLVSLTRGKRFELRQGKLAAIVAPQRPFQPMILVSAQAEARVVGTVFTLTATTNATRLEVTEGKVKLRRKSDDAAVPVSAGNFAVAAANYELAAQPFPGQVLREFWVDLAGDTLHDLTYHARYSSGPSGHDFPPSLSLIIEANDENQTPTQSTLPRRKRGSADCQSAMSRVANQPGVRMHHPIRIGERTAD